MGAIFLVRHAQASFGKENYDELSELGFKQSRLLGKEFEVEKKADAVISGTMKRHRQTAESSLDTLKARKSITIQPGFNEFNHEELIEGINGEWKDKTLFNNYLAQQENPRKVFHNIFSASVERWTSGSHDDEYSESWPQFQERVINALLAVRDLVGQSKTVFIFTSGGPISVICQWLLKLDNSRTFAINENLANTSITRLLYNSDRISLSYFNNYSHIERNGESYLSFR